MKKKLTFIFILYFFTSLVFSKTIFKKEGTLKNTYSSLSNKPDYKLEINCVNENNAVFRNDLYKDGVCIVREGELISINYTGAEVGGGGQGGGSNIKTVLCIKKADNEIYTTSFIVQKNDIYTVELFTEYSSSGSKTIKNEIISLRILGTDTKSDLSLVDGIRHYTGNICYYQNDELNYGFAVYCDEASSKISEWPAWYIKKGQPIIIYYKPYSNYSEQSGYGVGSGGQVSSGSGWVKDTTILKINGTVYNSSTIISPENDTIIELLYEHETSTSPAVTARIAYTEIKIDRNPPTVTYPEQVMPLQWTNNNVSIHAADNYENTDDLYNQGYIIAEDSETGFGGLLVYEKNSENEYIPKSEMGLDITVSGSGKYKIKVIDSAENETEINEIWIDQSLPEIIVYSDEAKSTEYNNTGWTNNNLFIDYIDNESGIKESSSAVYNQTGIYELWAKDYVGYEKKGKTIKIDKDNPSFKYTINYASNYDSTDTTFTIDITNIKDDHSGIKNVFVTPIIYTNGSAVICATKNLVNIIESETKETENIQYTYTVNDRKHDNYISFEVSVSDMAGNITTEKIGGDTGLFIPAAITTDYTELQGNKIKVNFFQGDSNGVCKPENYNKIILQRSILLKDKDNPNAYRNITAENFGNNTNSFFETDLLNTWLRLTERSSNIAIDTSSGTESYYIDTELERSGFTHKVISYDCIYEYVNPVDKKSIIREHFENAKKLELSNNKGKLFFKIKGNNNSYLIINSEGNIIEGSSDTFDMPDIGVVGIEIKIEDTDIEPYKIQIQGMVELTSTNGMFKLQETDTIPVGATGSITAVNNCFFTTEKPMTGEWVNLGMYALQYNIMTVFNIELTEGFPGQMEEWSNKCIKLYAKSPAILGGKARLLVGDASSYNADGITARPWQKIKMEIIPADENQILTNLTWDFGNGKTSENHGDYNKINNAKFEEIYYEQSEERTGALSEYKLKITSGTDEAEFNINIIDTQFGSLYGNEVWRGEHIIRKEIIIPSGMTLQIGDTAHGNKDPDIKCLCVGKIRAEEKGGITVEQGGTLILDEGDSKTIRFVQAALKNDIYCEADEKDRSWQNKWNGISVKGLLEGDKLNLQDADYGLTVFTGAGIELSDSIKLKRCKSGILMNGTELLVKEIRCNECSDYGIKLNSRLECEKMIVGECGRGVILKENGNLKTDSLEIQQCITGLHLLGGNLDIENGIISGCSEYGIKIDNDGIYDFEAVVIEDNERNIYENGVIR